MQVYYDRDRDLLYLRFDPDKQDVTNRRVSGDIVLDTGANGKVVGIEILDASDQVRLEKLLPVTYESNGPVPLAVREKGSE